MSTNWGTCPRCAAYGYLPHDCKAYKCAIEEPGEPYWCTVYALDAERAAEKYADEYDCGGDYTILKQGEAGETYILVRDGENNAAEHERFHVTGEAVPQYRARLRP